MSSKHKEQVNEMPKKRSSSEHEEEVTEIPKKKKKYRPISINQLKAISTMILSDKKHSNLIIDLIDQFTPEKTSPDCVSTIEQTFVKILERKDMTVRDTEYLSVTEKKYKKWLTLCYQEVWDKLGLCLMNGAPECRLQALNSMFKLLATEAKCPLKEKEKKKKKKRCPLKFPHARLKEILTSLMKSSPQPSAETLKRLSEFSQYKDIHTNVWIVLNSMLNSIEKEELEQHFWNVLLILHALPRSKKTSDVVWCDIKKGVPDERNVRVAVTNVWQHLARAKCSPTGKQMLLVVLLEKVMPKMENPIVLTDYFMDALARPECEITMLALQGIYNLVIKHNIEYPNIYQKLYGMLKEEILKAKYKKRLFILTDEFLRSTHLPLALVAAFVKKLSYLLPASTPPDLMVLLAIIGNILIRHPDLSIMYDDPNGKPVKYDPYDVNEPDPLKSNALNSRLWEVKCMQLHYTPRVAKMANFINYDLPKVEYDLRPLLKLTWTGMIKADLKKELKRITMEEAKCKEEEPWSYAAIEASLKNVRKVIADAKTMFIFTDSPPRDTNRSEIPQQEIHESLIEIEE